MKMASGLTLMGSRLESPSSCFAWPMLLHHLLHHLHHLLHHLLCHHQDSSLCRFHRHHLRHRYHQYHPLQYHRLQCPRYHHHQYPRYHRHQYPRLYSSTSSWTLSSPGAACFKCLDLEEAAAGSSSSKPPINSSSTRGSRSPWWSGTTLASTGTKIPPAMNHRRSTPSAVLPDIIRMTSLSTMDCGLQWRLVNSHC